MLSPWTAVWIRWGYSEHVFGALSDLAEDASTAAPCFQVFSQLAKERSSFICYGVPGIHPESGFTIRQVVLDDSGSVVSIYDKIHLCDFGDGRETKWFRPGERLSYFDCRGFRIGVMICADMRHTELSRELALGRGCDILLQPAAFARDVTFASWQSFVECRALENQVWLAEMLLQYLYVVLFLCSVWVLIMSCGFWLLYAVCSCCPHPLFFCVSDWTLQNPSAFTLGCCRRADHL